MAQRTSKITMQLKYILFLLAIFLFAVLKSACMLAMSLLAAWTNNVVQGNLVCLQVFYSSH